MRRKRSSLFLTVFLLFWGISWSQQDTLLAYDSFIEQVKSHHPALFRADLMPVKGEAMVREARGGFDPKLIGTARQKYFDGKQYYSHLNGAVKVPTWFGLSAEAGYDQASGVFLNPEDRLPEAGLWYAGLNLELGNGLIIDQRRAALKKARIAQDATELERTILRNEVLFQASAAYWEWAGAYAIYQVYEGAVENARIRLEGVRGSVQFGDKPAIDTVEASIQYQNRLLTFQDAQLSLLNSREALQLYLWDQGFVPLELNQGVTPQLLTSIQNPGIGLNEMDTLMNSHPYLLMNQMSRDQKQIDLRLKKEALKPTLSLKYRAINAQMSQGFWSEYTPANYNWGATFAYPILTRKERGAVRQAEIKVKEQEAKIVEVQAKIRFDINTSRNKLSTIGGQLEIFAQALSNYERLYNSEQTLFNAGESSLFMVNSREKSYLDAQNKWISLQVKQRIGLYELDYKLMRLDK